MSDAANRLLDDFGDLDDSESEISILIRRERGFQLNHIDPVHLSPFFKYIPYAFVSIAVTDYPEGRVLKVNVQDNRTA